MKMVRMSDLRAGRLYPQNHSAAGRIMSMKNSNSTNGNRTRDLPACSTVPQSIATARVPQNTLGLLFLFIFETVALTMLTAM
jgi:hypothetical protein